MEKFDLSVYEFINVSEGTDGAMYLTENQLEEMVADTVAVLKATKRKLKKTPTNLCLAAGLLGVRGGGFEKVAPVKANYKKGEATKEEIKLIKAAFFTARIYYLINNLIKIEADKDFETDGICPYLAKKKEQPVQTLELMQE